MFVGSHRGSVEPIISSGGVHPIRKSPPAAFRALPKYFAQAGRIAQRLNVPLGKTPVHTGDGWAGKKVYVSPRRHWALTNSRPSANVTLIILRVADLAAALLDSLFAHHAGRFRVVSNLDVRDGYRGQNEFFPQPAR